MPAPRLFAYTLLALCMASCAPPLQSEPRPVAETNAGKKTEATEQDSPATVSSVSGPAGIVLYCRHEGEIHLLLANDRLGRRGWGGFVGGNKEGESTAMTAARETSEETRGFYDPDWLLKKIADQKPVRQWACSFYFAEVAHVPAKRIMEHPVPLLNLAYMETQHYAWVPFSEIEPLLTKRKLTEADLRLHPRHLKPDSRSKSHWRVWIDNLRRMHLKEAFPWSR